MWDDGKKSNKIYVENTEDIKSETEEEGKSISNALSTEQPSMVTFEQGGTGSSAGITTIS